jgi:mannose-6-phosphate isomerase-like protein (cupin superfamily)
MSGYSINIEEKTLAGNNFREVLYTTPRSQLVIMTLQAGEEIGMEHHTGHDQFIRVEAGTGVAILDGEEHQLEDGVAVVVPAGTEHNVINTSKTEPMRLYTLYTRSDPPPAVGSASSGSSLAGEAEAGHLAPALHALAIVVAVGAALHQGFFLALAGRRFAI